MKELSKNIKVKIDGIMYKLPSSVVSKKPHSVITNITLGAKATALLLRQYLKTKFPKYKGIVKYDWYSGGSSIRLYISTINGEKIPEDVFKIIDEYASSFRSGKFDGMTDSYNYIKNDRGTSLGNEVTSYVSYVFCYNRPNEGTFEWAIKTYKTSDLTIEEIKKFCNSPTVAKRFEERLISDKILKL